MDARVFWQFLAEAVWGARERVPAYVTDGGPEFVRRVGEWVHLEADGSIDACTALVEERAANAAWWGRLRAAHALGGRNALYALLDAEYAAWAPAAGWAPAGD